jgi:hypothetical protein
MLSPSNPSGTWPMNYAFDQYFWQPDDDPKHGIGLFIRVRSL